MIHAWPTRRHAARQQAASLSTCSPESGVPAAGKYAYGVVKTTTIRLLLGLIRPTAARAEIFGLDVQKEKVRASPRGATPAGSPTW
jgi:hypothetical protein